MNPDLPDRSRASPDIGQVRAGGWPRRAFPVPSDRRSPDFPVVIRRSALNGVYGHGRSNTRVEVCGVLVGGVYEDEGGPYLYVEASIRGEHAGSEAAQVTFTPRTWAHIQEALEAGYPGRRVVGWYHTHPGFGIFLSAMDLFIQENFFDLPWQVALVYDPVGEEEGLFVWRDGRPTNAGYCLEEDVPEGDSRPTPRRAGPAEARAAAGPYAELIPRLSRLERRQAWLLVGLVAVAVVAVAWPAFLWNWQPGVRSEASEGP